MVEHAEMRKNLIFLAIALTSLLAATAAETQSPSELCASCISIRVGRPIVVRGPSGPEGDEADAPFSVIKLANGKFRGFTGNSRAYAIDGDTPWGLGGPARLVLDAGPKGSKSECGNWITNVVPVGSNLIRLSHHADAGKEH